MSVSICIPTYNRPNNLINCLNSLTLQTNSNFEVCISDNCSDENIEKLIEPYTRKMNIKFSRNKQNLGAALNFLKVASMAKNEFIWFIGDDDLLVPNAIEDLLCLIKKNSECDFFWINSSHLSSDFLNEFTHPFNTKNLPKNMKTLSFLKKDKKLMFFDLIKHKIAFDYLLGVFVCVFKKEEWNNNLHVIDYKMIKDKKSWSNFENTCFHIKIFCEAFKNSRAYFCSTPLSVNLHGVREWKNIYPFVEIVRIPEALDYYRSKGLNFFQYVYEKNYALRNFFNYFIKIFLNGEKMGSKYVNFKKHFLKNLIYPNSWLSIVYFISRKTSKILGFK
jgi:glycosyltransferase involved in cell wall biosynthesis